MRVTFIYPDFFQFPDGSFLPEGRIYLGIAYLAAVLKNAGHSVSLVHLVAPPEREQLVETVKSHDPDLIGYSSTTHMFRHIARIAEWLSALKIPTICGGVHPTIAPLEALSTSGIDMICIGEGEQTILEACEAMEADRDYSKIESLWIKRGDSIIKNRVRPLLENLDLLPFPDRTIFNPALLCPEQIPRGTVMASRGCPFNCTYCSNHAQKSVYPNPERYVRYRSPENVVTEIEELVKNDPAIEFIRFDDDILTLDIAWLEELAGLYKKRVGMPFICNSRVNFINEKTVQLLADMGCSVVCMGIESGNEWLRKNVLNRHMSNDQIINAFRLCKEFGIRTVSTNMVGLPFETTEMVLDTIRINALCKPDTIQVSTFIPYPGTELHFLCEKEGLLQHERVDSIFEGRSPLKRTDMSWENGAAKMNFHTLAYTFSHLYSLKPALPGKIIARAIESTLTVKAIPSKLRRFIFESFIRKNAGNHEPEWIKY